MKIRVLLVDDEKDFAEHLVYRLSIRDLAAEVVYSGEEAVEYVQKNPVDVVVLDQGMPGMDGIEALKEIKKARPEAQVILLTGYGSVEKAIEAKQHGAAEYLIKPYDTVQLAALIRDVHEKRASSQTENSQ